MDQVSPATMMDSTKERSVIEAACWGTRGSIASPGPDTVRFGGNTPCLEIRVRDGCLGCMVALAPPKVLAVPLSEAIAKLKLVPTDGDLVRTAKNIGVSFGAE